MKNKFSLAIKSWPRIIRWGFFLFGYLFLLSVMIIIMIDFEYYYWFPESREQLILATISGYICLLVTIQLIVLTLRQGKTRKHVIFSMGYALLGIIQIYLIRYISRPIGGMIPIPVAGLSLELLAIVITALTGIITALTSLIGQYTVRKKTLAEIEIEKLKLELEREKFLLEKEKLRKSSTKKGAS